MSYPLTQIPRELLEPWFNRYEKLYFVPAYPRHSRHWGIRMGSQSIYIGFNDHSYSQVIPQSSEELYLFYLYVDPLERRKGYGRDLMRDIIDISKELGYKRITLDVGYLNPEDRIPAKVLRTFYKSLGFKNEKGTKMVLDL